MNDFYQRKANKYKYKYLKLKNQLEGGMFKTLLKSIGFITDNCNQTIYTITPPIQISSNNIPSKYLTNEYIGQIMTNNEYNNYKQIKILDKEGNNTFKIEYEKPSIKKSDIKIPNYEDCLDSNITYNYIISKKSGKLFNLLEEKDIDKKNIKKILDSLIKGIEKIIKPLYNQGIILGDIKMENMYLDTNNNVYFSNYSKMHTHTDKIKVAEYSANLNTKLKFEKPNYSLLLAPFFKLEKDHNDITKEKKEEYNRDYLQNYYDTNIIIKELSIDTIDRKNTLEAIPTIFKTLIDKISINDLYENYIKRLAQNTDIYAIVMFIHYIFMSKGIFKIEEEIDNTTKRLLNELYYKVLNNDSELNINYLIKQIEQIRDSI